jgi:hypothetical protein
MYLVSRTRMYLARNRSRVSSEEVHQDKKLQCGQDCVTKMVTHFKDEMFHKRSVQRTKSISIVGKSMREFEGTMEFHNINSASDNRNYSSLVAGHINSPCFFQFAGSAGTQCNVNLSFIHSHCQSLTGCLSHGVKFHAAAPGLTHQCCNSSHTLSSILFSCCTAFQPRDYGLWHLSLTSKTSRLHEMTQEGEERQEK